MILNLKNIQKQNQLSQDRSEGAVRNSFFGVWFKKLEGVKDKDE